MRDVVLAGQRAWAADRGLSPDERGYLPSYQANLRAPLSDGTRAAFDQGSGSELRDGPKRPAKMRALHSSSALAVNVFDFWSGRDLGRVLRALGIEGAATSPPLFEKKLPTGAGGTPPNLDVVFPLADGRLVGVESKFTEWMSPKTAMAASLAPYRDVAGSSYWSRAELLAAHALVEAMVAGRQIFSYLDVPQLLKHSLGLVRASAPGSELRYLYFDAPGAEHDTHLREIDLFDAAVGSELRFRAMSYQALVAALQPARDHAEVAYFVYLRDRYFPR